MKKTKKQKKDNTTMKELEKKLTPESYELLSSILDNRKKNRRKRTVIEAVVGLAALTLIALSFVPAPQPTESVYTPPEPSTLIEVEKVAYSEPQAQPEKPTSEATAPIKKGGSAEQQELIALAWEISGYDPEMIITFEQEHGWIFDHEPSATNDYTFCQLNYKWHKTFLDDPKSLIPENQVRYCVDVWLDGKKKGTMPFNAYWVREIY